MRKIESIVGNTMETKFSRTWRTPSQNKALNILWRILVGLTCPIWGIIFMVGAVVILIIAEIVGLFWAAGNFIMHGEFDCPLWED
jgi:hypothetical protein